MRRQGGEGERVVPEGLPQLHADEAAEEAGRIPEREGQEQQGRHQGGDEQGLAPARRRQHERERQEEEQRSLLAGGEQAQRRAGDERALAAGHRQRRAGEAGQHQRLGPGLLEDEEGPRLEEDEERGQLSGGALRCAGEEDGRKGHEEEQRVADVAKEDQREEVQQHGQRRVGIGRDPAAHQKLGREHLRGLRAVDVGIAGRVRVDAVAQRLRPALLDDPDVHPGPRARLEDSDAHEQEAGEQQQEAGLHQRRPQVHAEIGGEEHQRRQRQPAEAARQQPRVAVKSRVAEQVTGEAVERSGGEDDLRRQRRLGLCAPAPPQGGSHRGGGGQRCQRERPRVVHAARELQRHGEHQRRQRAEERRSSGQFHGARL